MSNLSLNPRLSTSHRRAYSGDLKSLLNHSDERTCDFISTKKLGSFLIREKIITKDERSLMGGIMEIHFLSFIEILIDIRPR